jgi:hypothetical protein
MQREFGREPIDDARLERANQQYLGLVASHVFAPLWVDISPRLSVFGP